jgi:hypothetical protein
VELLAQRVDELLERAPRALVAALRPQVGEQHVTTHPARASHGEHREKPERLPLARQRVEPGAVAFKMAAAQGPESEHAESPFRNDFTET